LRRRSAGVNPRATKGSGAHSGGRPETDPGNAVARLQQEARLPSAARGFTLALFAVALAPLAAYGQAATPAEFDADSFHPAPGDNFLGVGDASVLPHLGLDFGAFLNLAEHPFFVEDTATNQVTELVASQTALDLTAGLGLFDRIELGLGLPVALTASGAP